MQKKNKIAPFFLLFTAIFAGTGCYSFKGFSINYVNTATFSIATFTNNAPASVPTLQQDLSEALRVKILNQTRLLSVPANGDVQFAGEVIGWQVSPVAPTAGESVSFNRLTISVMIQYTNLNDEQANWKKKFEWFADFSVDANLIDEQDRLVKVINEELTELIVNAAFSNW